MNKLAVIFFSLIFAGVILSKLSYSVVFYPERNGINMKEKWNNYTCCLFFSKEDCTVDPRQNYIFHYNDNDQSMVYLIVVNYHWNRFDSIPFLREKYFPRFHQLFNSSFDVVYFAPSYQSSLRVVSNQLPIGGYYSYYSLSLAYRIFGSANDYEYAGYFLINDDGFIDPLHLNNLNLNESLSEQSDAYSPNRTQRWIWNNRNNTNGVAFKDAYQFSIEEIQRSAYNSRCMLHESVNHRSGFYDFAFVVQRDISLYYELSLVFFKNRVFLEMAGPTISWCLSHRIIDSCNHYGWRNVRTCVYLHPAKLTDKSNEELILDHINRRNISRVPKNGWCGVFFS